MLWGDYTRGGRFGTSMTSAGDLNNDGFNDVIIGAPHVDENRGAVYVYHGGKTGILNDIKQVDI